MKKVFQLSCFVLFFQLAVAVSAQNSTYEFRHIDRNEGLSQSNVTAILQDHKGFMWFGTRDGLNKYDGYEITVYKNDPGNPWSISHNYIRTIYEDTKGSLWIGTEDGGLSLYNRSNDDFTNFKHDENDSGSISQNKVKAIFEDAKGRLWIGTGGGGLNLFDSESGSFTCFKHSDADENSLSGDNIEDIVEDENGNLWIATWDSGLNSFNVSSNEFDRFRADGKNANSLSSDYIKKLYLDMDNNLWVGTIEGGLNLYNLESKDFTRYQYHPGQKGGLNNNDILSIAEDKQGNLWIGTQNGGINIFDKEHKMFFYITYDEKNTEGLSNGSIYSLYRDRQGIMWVGTFSGGVNFRSGNPRKFMHCVGESSNGLNNNNVLAIYEDADGNIFLGTDGGGLNIYNKQQQKFTYFLNDPEDKRSIRSSYPLCIYEDSDEDIWIGGFYGKATIYNKDNHNFNNLDFDMDINHIATICEDSHGKIWMGTWGNGLLVYDKDKKHFNQYLPDPDKSGSISHNVIFSIYEDMSGDLWVGTEGGGLNLFDRRKDAFIQYKYDHNNAGSISNNIVNVIYEDTRGKLWVGTNGGLNLYNRDKKTFEVYTIKDGMPNNVVQAIEEDGNGNLWLSTNHGVARFDPTKTFRNYDISDGLQGNSFNRLSSFKNRKGDIYFGGINGFNVFHPDSIKDNGFIPPVYFTELRVFNKPVKVNGQGSPLNKQISETTELTLSYKQSVISFEFVALNYSLPEKNQYAYKLEGFDNDWNYVGTQRKATYTNLDPGEYVMRVKASNNDRVWNEKGNSIYLTITPPFWMTWWAKTTYILLSVVFLFMLRHLFIQRMKVKNRLEMDEIKLRFYASISHEFRTPLTLILGPLNQLATSDGVNPEKKQLLHMMQKNGQRLIKLINQLMHIYELDAGFMKLKVTEGDPIAFCKTVKEAFQYQAEKENIDYFFTADLPKASGYFDHDKLEKILLNLISNAFKYTSSHGDISVDIAVLQDNLSQVPKHMKRSTGIFARITVKDNGEGISKDFQHRIFDRFARGETIHQSQEGTGIGLSLARQLVLLHYGDILLESEVGKGSKFIVWLPIGKEAFAPNEIHDYEHDISLRLPDLQTEYGMADGESHDAEPVENQIGELPILLIVEDNNDIRCYLKQSFASTFQIEEAENGQQGLEKALDIIPDIIVSDVMMPALDGVEMCSRLKNNIRTSHIPIILLTAKADENFQIKALEGALADDFISKPFNAAVLLAKLRNMLQSREELKKMLYTNFLANPDMPVIPSVDEFFLKKAAEIVENNMDNPEFNVEKFSRDLGMSQTNMYRKLQSLLGISGNQFIRDIRMKRAVQLLSSSQYTISEIAYKVGFADAKYFSQSFKKQFGVLPTEFSAAEIS